MNLTENAQSFDNKDGPGTKISDVSKKENSTIMIIRAPCGSTIANLRASNYRNDDEDNRNDTYI